MEVRVYEGGGDAGDSRLGFGFAGGCWGGDSTQPSGLILQRGGSLAMGWAGGGDDED
jgi:hypothetical protein